MEEFRPWLADRLAITLINRQQVRAGHFREREGGAVEFTETGRKLVIRAYQERKRERLNHPLLDQKFLRFPTTLRTGEGRDFGKRLVFPRQTNDPASAQKFS